MRALRLCTFTLPFTLSLLIACTGDDKGDTDDPTEGTDSGDDDGGGDDDDDGGGDNEEPITQLMQELLWVTAKHRDANYFAHFVTWAGPGMPGVGAPGDDNANVGYFNVESTTRSSLDWVTDGPDGSLTGTADSYAGLGIHSAYDSDGTFTAALVTGDYYSDRGYTNGGSLTVYEAANVGLGISSTTEDALMIIYGDVDDGYLGKTSIGGPDLDGDGYADLATGGGEPGQLHIMSNFLSLSSGGTDTGSTDTADTGETSDGPYEFAFPTDATLSLTVCDTDEDGITDASIHCGANKDMIGDEMIVIFDGYNSNGGAGFWSAFELPLSNSSATIWQDMGSGVALPTGARSAHVETFDILLMNDPNNDRFRGIHTADGSHWGYIEMAPGSEAWGADFKTVDGTDWLVLSGSMYENGEGIRTGAVYAFDISDGFKDRNGDGDFNYEDADLVAFGTEANRLGWECEIGLTGDGYAAVACGAIYTSVTGPSTVLGMGVFLLAAAEEEDTGISTMRERPTETPFAPRQKFYTDDTIVQDLMKEGLDPGLVHITETSPAG